LRHRLLPSQGAQSAWSSETPRVFCVNRAVLALSATDGIVEEATEEELMDASARGDLTGAPFITLEEAQDRFQGFRESECIINVVLPPSHMSRRRLCGWCCPARCLPSCRSSALLAQKTRVQAGLQAACAHPDITRGAGCCRARLMVFSRVGQTPTPGLSAEAVVSVCTSAPSTLQHRFQLVVRAQACSIARTRASRWRHW
jgi:hypothetical protein